MRQQGLVVPDMKKLMENFKQFINEEQSVYTMELIVKAEAGTKLYGRVFEAIRGIEGVTVIRATEKIEKDREGNKLMVMSVRFYVNPAVIVPYIQKLKHLISNLKDAEGDRVLAVRVHKMPEKIDQYYT